MTPERARELLEVQVGTGVGYSRSSARLLVAEVAREHAQTAVDGRVREPDLDERFDVRPGSAFEAP